MKKIVIGIAAASAFAAGSPAAAQYANQNTDQNGYGQNGYGVGVGGDFAIRIEQVRARIQAGVQSGAINRAEAPQLREQLRVLTQLERQYSVGGLTGQERSTLQARLRTLRQQVRAAEGGGSGYGQDGYGQDRDDDYRQGSQGQRVEIDRNRDGFDDRDLDRDGRWDDDERSRTGQTYDNGQYGDDRGQDEEYQEPVRRGGIGGLIDNVLGRNGTAGTLRVGQRATSGLYALPSEYRNQYRDNNSAYFLTDGRQIYQIDARSQTVVRIYAMNR